MLEKTFCSSPWFHMRISSNGDLSYCRWAKKQQGFNIKNTNPIDFFQKKMSYLRKDLLDGKKLGGCFDCYEMEKNDKISGRQKQLLKSSIFENSFQNSFVSSQLFEKFKESYKNNGDTDLYPVDWQIDLGNFCNSACIMCNPSSSSKLANEWFNLKLIEKKYNVSNWTDDNELLEKFINSLISIKNLRYLHFLGGETLITPGFEKILKSLVNTQIAKDTIIGFTTNLTVIPKNILNLISQFKNVHVGFSIETLDNLNDFIRWPSNIDTIKNNLETFIKLGKEKEWLMSIRSTPTFLSIGRIVPLYEFALKNHIGIESCNFLSEPEYLKINLLPKDLRTKIIEDMYKFLNTHKTHNENKILNVRNPSTIKDYICQDLESYINYLEHEPYNDSQYKNFINFIKKIEDSRKLKLINFLPEYEKFFRSIGY